MLNGLMINRFEADYELTRKKPKVNFWGLGGHCWVCESCQAGYKVSHACGSGYGVVENALGLDTGKKVADALDDVTCGQGTKSWEAAADLATGGQYSGVKNSVETIGDVISCASSESWVPVVETIAGGMGTTGWSSGATGVGASDATWEGLNALIESQMGEECGEARCNFHKQDGEEKGTQDQDSVETQDEVKNETAKETTQEGQSQAETTAKEVLAVGGNPANANDIATGQAGNISRSQYNDLYGSVANSKASTQADYLNKMGYANALAQQASNIKKGSGLNVASGILQGMGAGASAGAGFSDETIKESPDMDVLSHIGKLVDMMTEVQQLKRGSK